MRPKTYQKKDLLSLLNVNKKNLDKYEQYYDSDIMQENEDSEKRFRDFEEVTKKINRGDFKEAEEFLANVGFFQEQSESFNYANNIVKRTTLGRYFVDLTR